MNALEGKEIAFCTYHLKTLFFYHCENGAPLCSSIDATIKQLTKALLTALESKNCANYFIPSHSMFGHLDDGELVEAALVIKKFDIREENLDAKLTQSSFTLDLCRIMNMDIKRLQNGDISSSIILDDLHDHIDKDYDTYAKTRLFGVVNHFARHLQGTENYDFAMHKMKGICDTIQNLELN